MGRAKQYFYFTKLLFNFEVKAKFDRLLNDLMRPLKYWILYNHIVAQIAFSETSSFATKSNNSGDSMHCIRFKRRRDSTWFIINIASAIHSAAICLSIFTNLSALLIFDMANSLLPLKSYFAGNFEILDLSIFVRAVFSIRRRLRTSAR